MRVIEVTPREEDTNITTENLNTINSQGGAPEVLSVKKVPRSESKGLTVSFSPLHSTGAPAAPTTSTSSPDSKKDTPTEDNSSSSNKENKDQPSGKTAIFSPKSAANALTSLFTQSAVKARQVFPSTSPSTATTSTEGMSPPTSSTKSEASATESSLDNASSPPQNQAETPSTTGGSPPQWDGMQMKQAPHHYPNQQPSPPAVYYSTFPPPCYAEGPPGGHWRHPQYQGPWTPIVGGKVPGRTPHHHRGPPHQTFAWDPSQMGSVMEVRTSCSLLPLLLFKFPV